MSRIITIILLFTISTASAEIIQKGSVTLMSSGLKPVSGVQIIINGAAPTISDGNGAFKLIFSDGKFGDPILIESIYKNEYEVVNIKDIQSHTLSSERELSIVVCDKKTLSENRRIFYEVGSDIYRTKYMDGVKELELLMNEGKLSRSEHDNKMSEIANEYKESNEKLGYYATKFARVNTDNINELDSRALELVKNGDVDGAIRLYEDSKILEQFVAKVAQRDTSNCNIAAYKEELINQIKIYKTKDDSIYINKIEEIKNILIEIFPNDPQVKNL